MKILILGAGKMGSFFTDLLSFEHEVAVLESDPKRMRFIYNATSPTEAGRSCRIQTRISHQLRDTKLYDRSIQECHALPAAILYHLGYRIGQDTPEKNFTKHVASRMFLPTRCLVRHSPIWDNWRKKIRSLFRRDHLGKIFFKDIYSSLRLHICEYTFEEHDKVVAYSLGIPFASTMVFAATMKHQDAPGTTFKRHMKIARGLLSEDDYLLTEILFNPRTPHQIARIQEELDILQEIIKNKDSERMKEYLTKIRKNIE